MTKIAKQIEWIEGELKKYHTNIISISTGRLPLKLIAELGKNGIRATDDGFLGYWKFERVAKAEGK